MGAVLSFGPTWESTRPVAFKSQQLHGAELHYPIHKQEMLSIIHVLKKWQSDLLGSHFTVYTDHHMLQNFEVQKDLSKRQAHWMEYMSQYDCSINYICREDNCVADALSRLPNTVDGPSCIIAGIFEICSNPSFVQDIKDRYCIDPWCKALVFNLAHGMTDHKLNITSRNGLIFISPRLIIPKHKNLQESLFHLAHNNLRHFSSEKSYNMLQADFY